MTATQDADGDYPKNHVFKFPTERYLNIVKRRGYKDCGLDKPEIQLAKRIIRSI